MERRSPSAAIKLVDGQIYIIERRLNLSLLSKKERDNLSALHQNLADARQSALDFEASETADELAKYAKSAKRWLTQAQKRIITASQSDIFEAADVAQLSAQLEHITADIKE